MADTHKDNRLKIITYSLLVILVGVGSYYYYNYLQNNSAEINQSAASTISKSLSGKKLDTNVLKDKKFQELQPIVVEESVLGQAATSTSPVASFKLEEIAKVPRRHSDPFKPF